MAATERITLSDDGTMDTVLVCECGEEFRYNYDGQGECDHGDACRSEQCAQDGYDAFVTWAIEDAESEHDCPTWDRSGCQDQVCTCHDETATPYACSQCGCQPRAEV